GRAPATPGRSAALPQFIAPELARLVAQAPDGDDWLHEIKFDGYRLACRLDHGQVRLWSRNRIEWTSRLPGLVDALAALPARTAFLDGELVTLDARGRSRFELLKQALGSARRG